MNERRKPCEKNTTFTFSSKAVKPFRRRNVKTKKLRHLDRTHSSEYTDKELLELFRDGQRANYAFNLIVRKHTPALYRLVRRMVLDADDTDDVLQNVFIKAWKALPGFREDAALGTWLYRIASNESISFINKKRRFLFLPLQSQETYLSQKLEADSYTDYEAGEKKFQKAVLSLPEKQRLVFNLKFYEDMTYEQISEITGTSVGALKASYHIAGKKIESMLQAD